MQLNSYLTFGGQCKEAFEFYQKTLGGTMEAMITHAGTPAESHVAPELRDRILHARLKVGDSLLMGSDGPPERYQRPVGFSVNIGIQDPAEAERIFKTLSEDGIIQMPYQKTFWARGFGMAIDRFGTPWMINCE